MTLRVDAELVEPPSLRRDSAPVRVTIINDGPEAMVVNSRLAPGYANSLSREIYAELTTTAGAPAAYAVVRYQRDWPTDEDLVTLAPGESITGEFDLFRWYRPLEPGAYLATVVYSDEQGDARSEPLELEVG